MRVFTYKLNETENVGQLTKSGTSKPSYIVDFAQGMGSGITLSSATSAAVNSSNTTATTDCVTAAATVSGTTARVDLLTCGSSGTSAATDGARFRIRTTATLSTGTLTYDVFVFIKNTTYDPD